MQDTIQDHLLVRGHTSPSNERSRSTWNPTTSRTQPRSEGRTGGHTGDVRAGHRVEIPERLLTLQAGTVHSLEERLTTPSNQLKNAGKKYLNRAVNQALADYAKSTGCDRRKAYLHAVFCRHQIIQLDGIQSTTTCKERSCFQCSARKSAITIQKHIEEVKNWNDAHLLTLTRPNVKGLDLRTDAKNTIKEVGDIIIIINKDRKRKGLPTIKCLRSYEVTANVVWNDYHGHIHALVSNLEDALEIRRRYLERNPQCDPTWQDVQKADEDSIYEVIKYATKAVALQDGKKTPVPAEMLDTIFKSIKGIHLIRNHGYKMAEVPKERAPLKAWKRETENIIWTWIQIMGDYIDLDTGDTLTGYVPSEQEQATAEVPRTRKQALKQRVKRAAQSNATEHPLRCIRPEARPLPPTPILTETGGSTSRQRFSTQDDSGPSTSSNPAETPNPARHTHSRNALADKGRARPAVSRRR
jgi:hypothetical protein